MRVILNKTLPICLNLGIGLAWPQVLPVTQTFGEFFLFMGYKICTSGISTNINETPLPIDLGNKHMFSCDYFSNETSYG